MYVFDKLRVFPLEIYRRGQKEQKYAYACMRTYAYFSPMGKRAGFALEIP
jgi:hypothetical protein